MGTNIEWCDESVNPIRTKEGGWHCVKSSPGCLNCYAEKINKRFGDKLMYKENNIGLEINKNALNKITKWKKQKKIFVQDMSDLFLNKVTDCQLNEIFNVIENNPKHIYIVLTKRPERMRRFLIYQRGWGSGYHPQFIYLGITAENQEMFDKRWAYFKQTPAAVYMISYEPALGPLVLPPDFLALGKRAWVVCGMESLGNRPGRIFPRYAEAIRNVKNQCVAAGVPFFLKQGPCSLFETAETGKYKMVKMPELDGRQWNEFP